MNAIPHIGNLIQENADSVLNWADAIVVAQKPSSELAARLLSSGLPMIDLVGSKVGKIETTLSPALA